MKKLLFIALLAPLSLFAQHDPGAWTYTTHYRTDSTRLAINGHGVIRDTMTTVITCNPKTQVITFRYMTDWLAGDSMVIHYGMVEDYETSGHARGYLRGSYYYHTAGYGDVEYHPKEMVVVNDPISGTRIEFLP